MFLSVKDENTALIIDETCVKSAEFSNVTFLHIRHKRIKRPHSSKAEPICLLVSSVKLLNGF